MSGPSGTRRPSAAFACGRLLLTLATVLAASAATAPAAIASAFYNDTDDDGFPATFGISLSCGVFCSNAWTVAPGHSVSRPGKGGSFALGVSDCDETDSHPEVQDHGWVRLGARSATARYWAIYGSSGDLVGDYDVEWRDYPPGRIPTPATCSKGS